MNTNTLPKPVRWLNYAGRTSTEIGEVMGPNTLGEFLTVVEVTYDPEANKTRIGLTYEQVTP